MELKDWQAKFLARQNGLPIYDAGLKEWFLLHVVERRLGGDPVLIFVDKRGVSYFREHLVGPLWSATKSFPLEDDWATRNRKECF